MIQIDMPMPEGCVECRFYQGVFLYCHAMPENFSGYVDYCEENGRPEWCPLIAQAPRVMTLEEARNVEVVWVEDRNEREIYPCIVKNNMNDSKLYKYGVQWRCWTARPTEEQREGQDWNGVEGLTSSGALANASTLPSPACALQGEGKALGCETCRHHLGAGVCAVSLEMECRDGNYEAWEEKDGNGQNSMRDC